MFTTYQRLGVLLREVDAVHELAVDVELDVVDCPVADVDGLGALVAREVDEVFFGEVFAAVDGVHAGVSDVDSKDSASSTKSCT